ncbi:MAG: cell division protein FtsW [Treponema sp.]|nr:cell division protein FtsW [Treponema sp.]
MDSYQFAAERPLERYRKSDAGVLACIIMLCGLGIFTLIISSQHYALRVFNDQFYFVKRQLVMLGIGTAMMIFFAALPIKTIRRLLPFIVIGTLVLCILTFIPPLAVERNGARRWIRMPFGFTLQPSELAKFAVVLFLANLFDKQASIVDAAERSVMPAVIGLTVFVALIFAQKDFSTGVFILLVGILLFFVSGMRLLWLLPFSPLAVLSLCLLIALEPYRMERIIGFIRPDINILTYNYQSVAAKRAISAGGFLGTGIGSGIEWSRRVPEVHADYIFTGWTEAMGFAGVLLYLCVLFLFAWRGYRASFMARNRFAAYGAFGCVSMIVVQSLMNIGVVCGVLPVTGIPLPFFSLGGSSILVTLMMCGFIINVSRNDPNEDAPPSDEYQDERYRA